MTTFGPRSASVGRMSSPRIAPSVAVTTERILVPPRSMPTTVASADAG